MLGIMIGTAIFIIIVAWAYFKIEEALTGKPGPFTTLHYTDEGQLNYQEIVGYLEDRYGPNIVLNLHFIDYQHPNYWQGYLITKSTLTPRIKIEVIL